MKNHAIFSNLYYFVQKIDKNWFFPQKNNNTNLNHKNHSFSISKNKKILNFWAASSKIRMINWMTNTLQYRYYWHKNNQHLDSESWIITQNIEKCFRWFVQLSLLFGRFLLVLLPAVESVSVTTIRVCLAASSWRCSLPRFIVKKITQPNPIKFPKSTRN